jgi:hypothetical protein
MLNYDAQRTICEIKMTLRLSVELASTATVSEVVPGPLGIQDHDHGLILPTKLCPEKF